MKDAEQLDDPIELVHPLDADAATGGAGDSEDPEKGM
jgi:hypothetical protein